MREDMNEHQPANQVHVSETVNDVPGPVDAKKTLVVTQLPTITGAIRTTEWSLPVCCLTELTLEPAGGHSPAFSIRELASDAIR